MATSPPNGDTPSGFVFSISAYVLWGLLPLYIKLLEHVPPVEVIAHRVIWSVPIAALVLVALGRTSAVRHALQTPRFLAMAALTAGLISLNWGVYVWAIANDQAVQAALGYYANPLFSIALGAVLLKERLDRLQWIAVALAAVAVLILTVSAGGLPWVAILLMGSFGIYGFLRKTLPIGPNQGFLLEVLLLTPPAVAYLLWLGPEGHFIGSDWHDTALLLGCGAVTAIPLMLYGNGVKRLRMTTMGILQYIAPTMIFLIAVLVFDEPFGTDRAVAFPLIWLALVFYTVSLLRNRASKAN